MLKLLQQCGAVVTFVDHFSHRYKRHFYFLGRNILFLLIMAGSSSRNRKREGNHSRKATKNSIATPTCAAWTARKTPYITTAIAIGISLVLWLFNQSVLFSRTSRWFPTPANEWENRRAQVKDAFVNSWDAYSKHAWGS
jgi:hypothetical protein